MVADDAPAAASPAGRKQKDGSGAPWAQPKAAKALNMALGATAAEAAPGGVRPDAGRGKAVVAADAPRCGARSTGSRRQG